MYAQFGKLSKSSHTRYLKSKIKERQKWKQEFMRNYMKFSMERSEDEEPPICDTTTKACRNIIRFIPTYNVQQTFVPIIQHDFLPDKTKIFTKKYIPPLRCVTNIQNKVQRNVIENFDKNVVNQNNADLSAVKSPKKIINMNESQDHTDKCPLCKNKDTYTNSNSKCLKRLEKEMFNVRHQLGDLIEQLKKEHKIKDILEKFVLNQTQDSDSEHVSSFCESETSNHKYCFATGNNLKSQTGLFLNSLNPVSVDHIEKESSGSAKILQHPTNLTNSMNQQLKHELKNNSSSKQFIKFDRNQKKSTDINNVESSKYVSSFISPKECHSKHKKKTSASTKILKTPTSLTNSAMQQHQHNTPIEDDFTSKQTPKFDISQKKSTDISKEISSKPVSHFQSAKRYHNRNNEDEFFDTYDHNAYHSKESFANTSNVEYCSSNYKSDSRNCNLFNTNNTQQEFFEDPNTSNSLNNSKIYPDHFDDTISKKFSLKILRPCQSVDFSCTSKMSSKSAIESRTASKIASTNKVSVRSKNSDNNNDAQNSFNYDKNQKCSTKIPVEDTFKSVRLPRISTKHGYTNSGLIESRVISQFASLNKVSMKSRNYNNTDNSQNSFNYVNNQKPSTVLSAEGSFGTSRLSKIPPTRTYGNNGITASRMASQNKSSNKVNAKTKNSDNTNDFQSSCNYSKNQGSSTKLSIEDSFGTSRLSKIPPTRTYGNNGITASRMALQNETSNKINGKTKNSANISDSQNIFNYGKNPRSSTEISAEGSFETSRLSKIPKIYKYPNSGIVESRMAKQIASSNKVAVKTKNSESQNRFNNSKNQKCSTELSPKDSFQSSKIAINKHRNSGIAVTDTTQLTKTNHINSTHQLENKKSFRMLTKKTTKLDINSEYGDDTKSFDGNQKCLKQLENKNIENKLLTSKTVKQPNMKLKDYEKLSSSQNISSSRQNLCTPVREKSDPKVNMLSRNRTGFYKKQNCITDLFDNAFISKPTTMHYSYADEEDDYLARPVLSSDDSEIFGDKQQIKATATSALSMEMLNQNHKFELKENVSRQIHINKKENLQNLDILLDQTTVQNSDETQKSIAGKDIEFDLNEKVPSNIHTYSNKNLQNSNDFASSNTADNTVSSLDKNQISTAAQHTVKISDSAPSLKSFHQNYEIDFKENDDSNCDIELNKSRQSFDGLAPANTSSNIIFTEILEKYFQVDSSDCENNYTSKDKTQKYKLSIEVETKQVTSCQDTSDFWSSDPTTDLPTDNSSDENHPILNCKATGTILEENHDSDINDGLPNNRSEILRKLKSYIIEALGEDEANLFFQSTSEFDSDFSDDFLTYNYDYSAKKSQKQPFKRFGRDELNTKTSGNISKCNQYSEDTEQSANVNTSSSNQAKECKIDHVNEKEDSKGSVPQPSRQIELPDLRYKSFNKSNSRTENRQQLAKKSIKASSKTSIQKTNSQGKVNKSSVNKPPFRTC